MCRPWYGCDDCASCFIYLSSVIFPRHWTPKTVNGIEKKKKDSKFPYVRGASFDFYDFENFQSFKNEARR